MRLISASVLLATLLGCGSQIQEHDGNLQSIRALDKSVTELNKIRKIIKNHIHDPEEALEFLHTHPFVKTIGIRSNLFANELGIHPRVWGRYVNSDSSLTTKNLSVEGKPERHIFTKGFLPEDQIARVIDDLDPERFKQGVAIEEVANNVHFKQEFWTMQGFHRAIGRYLDKKKYVTHRIRADGKTETRIFDKGFLPEDQVTRVIDGLDSEKLKQGVTIAEIADAVHFKQDTWSTDVFHTAVGMYLDKKKYTPHLITIDGKPETYIYTKGFLPEEQVAKAIDGLDEERFKQGVLIEEIADAVHFKQDSWSTHSFHKAIGQYLDREKYVTDRIKVDGKRETRIFDKGFLPEDQVARVIDGLDSERFKQGVAIEEVANNVHFKQDSWSTMGFHNVIGLYLDRKKYVTRQITVGGKDETRIFAKGFSPEDQVARVIGDLDEERLKQGVPIEEIADAVHFKQDSWSTHDFHNAIGKYLDREKHVTRKIREDGKLETRIFTKGFLPEDQVARVVDGLDPERLKQGVAIEEIADAVHFKQESWTMQGFHGAIGRYLDKKKYVTRPTSVDGKLETRIFAK